MAAAIWTKCIYRRQLVFRTTAQRVLGAPLVTSQIQNKRTAGIFLIFSLFQNLSFCPDSYNIQISGDTIELDMYKNLCSNICLKFSFSFSKNILVLVVVISLNLYLNNYNLFIVESTQENLVLY